MKLVKIRKPAPKDAAEWVGFACAVGGFACLGAFFGGLLLAAALGLLAAAAVLLLVGNV